MSDTVDKITADRDRFYQENPDIGWVEFKHTQEAVNNIKKKIHFLINTQNGSDIDDYTLPEEGTFIQKSREYFAGKNVLIIGTGTGREMEAAKRLGAKSVKGITMGARNKKFAEDIVGETPDIVDAHACPWEDSSFDLILGFQVMEHMYSPVMFLLECNRLLRVGGEVHIETPPSRNTSTDSWLHHIMCPTPRQLICLYMKTGFKPTTYQGSRSSGTVEKDVSLVDTTSDEEWLDATDCNVYLRGVKQDPSSYERGDIARFYSVLRTGIYRF